MKFSKGTESSAVVGGDRGGDDSESSDWSSSSDDEGGSDDGEGVRGMKPSHHTNLIAEWEWRTMADSTATRSVRVHPKHNHNGNCVI